MVTHLGEFELNRTYHIDALDGLKKLPSKSIDLIIADPPYFKTVGETWDYLWRTEEDYIEWAKPWISEIGRVAKPTASFYLFGYFRTLSRLVLPVCDVGFDFRQQIIVDKGLRAISGRATKNYQMFPTVTESVLIFAYNNKPFIKQFLKERQAASGLTAKEINDLLEVKSNGGGLWSLYTGENILAQTPTKENWEKLQKILKFDPDYAEIKFPYNAQMGLTDVWRDIDFYAEERYHPTQKPRPLIERLLIASSKEGQLVLDPFMGGGSTALACKQLKRNFIGFEIDPKYVKVANSRLKNTLLI